MTWNRLPLFVWAHYATSIIQVLGTPVVAITIVLVALERLFHLGIFNPALGGDPLLFQHLFWFYSHPAVYIMILPGMGIISEIVCCFSRKRIFGYKAMAMAAPRHRGDRVPGLGAPHVRRRHLALCGSHLLAVELLRRGALGHQGLQLDRHHVQGVDHLPDARCSTPSASSACLPSAASRVCFWRASASMST